MDGTALKAKLNVHNDKKSASGTMWSAGQQVTFPFS
jgi:hypothetical protein